MADDDLDYDEDDHEDDDGSSVLGKVRRNERKLKAENKRLSTEAEQGKAAQRDLVFLRAGIDLEDPKAYWFRKAYDGDLDPVAVKAEAEKAGLLAPAEQDQDVAGHQTANAAGAGAQGVQPSENRDAEYKAELAKTTSREETLAVMAKYGSPVVDQMI